jgi:hypothetical protein
MRHAFPLPSVPPFTCPRCSPRCAWRLQLRTLRVRSSESGGVLHAHPMRYCTVPIVESQVGKEDAHAIPSAECPSSQVYCHD